MNLKGMLIYIITSLMSVPAFATGTISGTVTDTSSQPLPGVAIQLYNQVTGDAINRAGLADASGNYSIANVPAGTYRVIFFGNNSSSAPLTQKWYAGASGFAAATPVTVTNATVTANINATMGAVAQPTINLGSSTNAAPGTVVKIPVTLAANGAAISAAEVTITYDPTKILNVTSFDPSDQKQTKSPGPAASGKAVLDSTPAEGTYKVGLMSSSNTNVLGDGVLINLYFSIAADASGPIVLTSIPMAADPSGANVAVTGASGNISY